MGCRHVIAVSWTDDLVCCHDTLFEHILLFTCRFKLSIYSHKSLLSSLFSFFLAMGQAFGVSCSGIGHTVGLLAGCPLVLAYRSILNHEQRLFKNKLYSLGIEPERLCSLDPFACLGTGSCLLVLPPVARHGSTSRLHNAHSPGVIVLDFTPFVVGLYNLTKDNPIVPHLDDYIDYINTHETSRTSPSSQATRHPLLLCLIRSENQSTL